jgi:Mrp family chromosome partitioning ATPase/Fe-S cluster biogenesis protein NfuA
MDNTQTQKTTTQAIPDKQAIPGVDSIIAVASGKGGVGKSMVAANLAVALAERGARVGLLDADIYGPSIPDLLGATEQPQMRQDGIVPAQSHGVSFMSLGILLGGRKPVIWRGPMVHKVVAEFLTQVRWGELDYLIVDLPPGTGDAQLTLCQSVPLAGVVIVTTPQDLAAEIAANALLMFRHMEVPVLGIVENMGTFVCPHCGAASEVFSQGGAERTGFVLGAPLLGSIPLDPAICRDGDAGVPTVLAHPDSPSGRALREIAERTAERAARIAASPQLRAEALGAQFPHPSGQQAGHDGAADAHSQSSDQTEPAAAKPSGVSDRAAAEGDGMKEKIEEALATIRPYIQMDGGDVEFVDYVDGVVKVRLTGACAGCPMSQMTLAMGVEKTLKEKIPEVTRVEAVS